MKTRESGMPEESMWAEFFDPPAVLGKLGLNGEVRDVLEVGCGYGTFSVSAARIVRGTVHALDIDPAMIEHTRGRFQTAGLTNVRLELRDIVQAGSGVPDRSVDYVMLFNILHAECPEVLLHEAYRVLRAGGRLGIMHWNYDPSTPRGPSMSIRPRPQQCRQWAEAAGFVVDESAAPIQPIDLPPYHYGWVLQKPAKSQP